MVDTKRLRRKHEGVEELADPGGEGAVAGGHRQGRRLAADHPRRQGRADAPARLQRDKKRKHRKQAQKGRV